MNPHEAEDSALAKLEAFVHDGFQQRPVLTPEEKDAFEKWVRFCRALQAMGWLGGLIKPIIVGAAAVIGAIAAVRLGILDLFGVPK